MHVMNERDFVRVKFQMSFELEEPSMNIRLASTSCILLVLKLRDQYWLTYTGAGLWLQVKHRLPGMNVVITVKVRR